ncbi:hypothetical protein Bca101_058336 [Brassica carinata]
MWSDGMHFIVLSENLVRDRFLLSSNLKPRSTRSERRFRRTDLANDTCLWEPKLLLRVGNRAAGTCVASSPDSDLEAFSHNPAPRSKGSIGHAFTVRIRSENQNQSRFYPFVPHEISVLVELILGHLRYLLTDVPPQPNSPPDNVLRRIDREASLGSKRRGCYPLGSRIGCSAPKKLRESCSQSVPGRHAACALAALAARAVRQQSTGSNWDLRAQPSEPILFRSYGSILPTSLAYIVPSTRGCSPWRPDAVMSTTGRGGTRSSGFSRAAGMHGHHAACGALPAAGPYLRLSRFRSGHAVKQKR